MASARNKRIRPTRRGTHAVPAASEPVRDEAAVPLAGRKRKFRLITVGLVLLVCWGIPEGIVRLANPPLEAFKAIYFAGDPNSPKLFMKDWRLHWKLRPGVATDFLKVAVRTNRYGFRGADPEPGRRVVLCMGDSTPFGWRVEESDSFPVKLQARLDAVAKSAKTWNVINAGVPGYTSFQLRLQAEQLVARWKPAVLVVCVGNNEAWPVEHSDRQVDAGRALTGRLGAVLSASRFLVWAAEKLRREAPRPFIAPALESAVPRVSREEFGENLRAIARAARAANAHLVFLSPPVNLYWPPTRFNQFAGWEKWQEFYQSMQDLRATGDANELLARATTALAEHPDSFYALWIKGSVLTDVGDVDGGRELLEQAIEHHPFPENCRRSYRQVVAEVAQDVKAGFVDVNALFIQHAERPIPQHLYLDWCHPTPQGHAIIADALFEKLAGEGN